MEQINNEINRCLNCKKPRCVEACPLYVNIPEMINLIKQDKIEEAFKIDLESNPFGLICGLVCPHEKQCQGACVRGIKETPVQIGKIENFICRESIKSYKNTSDVRNEKAKVAIIGGGPSGLACAYVLSKQGIKSTIFEKEKYLGGILMYGIPDFRLDKSLVQENIKFLLNENIEVVYEVELVTNNGKKNENQITIEGLKEKGYDYIFISIGQGSSKSLNIEGIESEGVVFATDYLKDYYNQKLSKSSEEVLVIGGGNVAIDAVRTANKLSNSATIVYRKTMERMPANKSEIEEAINEGVKFIFETNITKIAKSNEKLIATLNEEDEIECDKIILAIGNAPNKNCFEEYFEFDENNLIKVYENNMTNIKNIYAGGDLIQNKNTVAYAIRSGIIVAKDISKNINELHK